MTDTTTPTTAPVVTTAVIPAQRVFRKAREVLKTRFLATSPRASELNFDDFTAHLDTATKQVTLTVIDNPSQAYDASTLQPFTYQVDTVETFVFNVLNFAREYKVEQKEQIEAALPEGLSITFAPANEEGTIVGTVTIDAQATEFQFASSITPASVFLEQHGEGSTTTITFVKDREPIIDLSEYLTGGDLGRIAAADLVEPIEG